MHLFEAAWTFVSVGRVWLSTTVCYHSAKVKRNYTSHHIKTLMHQIELQSIWCKFLVPHHRTCFTPINALANVQAQSAKVPDSVPPNILLSSKFCSFCDGYVQLSTVLSLLLYCLSISSSVCLLYKRYNGLCHIHEGYVRITVK